MSTQKYEINSYEDEKNSRFLSLNQRSVTYGSICLVVIESFFLI